jgi:hypothetical protein
MGQITEYPKKWSIPGYVEDPFLIFVSGGYCD